MLRKFKSVLLVAMCLTVISVLSNNLPYLNSILTEMTEAATFTISNVYSDTGQRHPSVKTDGTAVSVAYQLYTSDGPIYFKRSTGGTTFPADPGVKVADEDYGYLPRLDIDNAGTAYVVYTQYREGGAGKGNYWIGGCDGSTTFNYMLNIVDNLATGTDGADAGMQSDVAVEKISSPNNVYAVFGDFYHDTPDAWHIFYTYSTDGGTTWTIDSETDVDISTIEPARYPAIAVPNNGSSTDAYVVWNSNNADVMYSKVTSAGAHTAEASISNAGSDVIDGKPRIAATTISGTDWLFAVWSDATEAANNIYFNYSDDTGWKTAQLLACASERVHSQIQPVIAVLPGAKHVYVAWTDDRDGQNHIYFQEGELQTGDTAFTFGIDLDGNGDISAAAEKGIDLRVDTGSGIKLNPSIDARGSAISPNVFVVWDDTGAGIKCGSYALEEAALTPSPPSNLTATGHNGSISLSWTGSPSPNVTYNVYRSTERGSWPTVATASGITLPTYNDTGLTNSIAYWYVVTAENIMGTESDYSNDARATANADTTPPDAPTGLEANAYNQAIMLSWIKAAEQYSVAGYHIYRSVTTGKDYTYVTEKSYSAEAKYTNTGLTNGTRYYYVITALDGLNNESADSDEKYAIPEGPGSITNPGSPPTPGMPTPNPQFGPSVGGCFIATAAYGGALSEDVLLLSKFRDDYLLTNSIGRGLVTSYYKTSPSCARFIAGRPFLKTLVRWELRALVKLLGYLQ